MKNTLSKPEEKQSLPGVRKNYANSILDVFRTKKIDTEELQAKLKPFLEEVEALTKSFGELFDANIVYHTSGSFIIADDLFGKENMGPITQENIKQAQEKIEQGLQKCLYLEQQLHTFGLPPTMKEIYVHSISEYKDKLHMIYASIPLEAEKGGYTIANIEDKDKLLEKVFHYNQKIYGPRVSDVPEERNQVLNKFYANFEDKKNKLTEEEQKFYKENFLDLLQKKYQIPIIQGTGDKQEKETEEETVNEQDKKESIMKKELFNRTHQKEVFDEMYAVEKILNQNKFAMQERSIELTDEISSASVDSTKNIVKIPNNDKNINIENICSIFQHEVGKHAISDVNTNAILGQGFKGAQYIELEEGMAKLFEFITKGKVRTTADIPKIAEKPAIGMLAVFVCENYNYEDSIKIMELYGKMNKSANKAVDLVRRRKRFVAYDRPGASTKDTAYTRGLKKIGEVFIGCKNTKQTYELIHMINCAKLGFDDFHLIPKLLKELGIKPADLTKTHFIGRNIYKSIKEIETPENGTRLGHLRDRVAKKLGIRKKVLTDS